MTARSTEAARQESFNKLVHQWAMEAIKLWLGAAKLTLHEEILADKLEYWQTFFDEYAANHEGAFHPSEALTMEQLSNDAADVAQKRSALLDKSALCESFLQSLPPYICADPKGSYMRVIQEQIDKHQAKPKLITALQSLKSRVMLADSSDGWSAPIHPSMMPPKGILARLRGRP